MNKYEHSKIYKIVNDVDDMIYVGSTYQKLDIRWGLHMYDYKRHPEYNLYKKMHEIGIEHFKMILISIYPCETKEQLLWREREEFDKYDKNKLLNKFRPKVTKEEEIEHRKKHDKEYHEIHKDRHNKYKREYYVKNIETIKIKDKLRHQKYYQANKEKITEKVKLYREKKPKIYDKEKQKKWIEKNQEHYTQYRTKYNKQYWIQTKLLKLLPLYNVTQKETHLYF